MNGDTLAHSYNQEPYYLNAKLKVRNFRTSGAWQDTDCGSSNTGPFFGTNTNSTLNGRDWMRAVCNNPP